MINPFVLATYEEVKFKDYIQKYKEDKNIILDYVLFKESDYYLETHYPFITAYFFEYGYKDPNKTLTKTELDIAFWEII